MGRRRFETQSTLTLYFPCEQIDSWLYITLAGRNGVSTKSDEEAISVAFIQSLFYMYLFYIFLGFFGGVEFFYVLYSTLLHLRRPSEECWE
jgi:hypothetical protein